MISLDKCNGGYNVVDDLSMKICVRSKTKDVNIKVFNMITTTDKIKTLEKYFSWNCKCKFDSTTCNASQKLNND